MNYVDESTPKILTFRQAETLVAIQEYIASRGVPPTILELCEILGTTSPGTIRYQLKQMAEKGRLLQYAHTHRGIRVLQPYTATERIQTV